MELRKRKRSGGCGDGPATVEQFLDYAGPCNHVVVFTGSGLSATSGMSMFSTRNGLYDRARKKFKIQDGIKLFTYSFYKTRRADVQAFFAQIYSEAQESSAALGHKALAQIHELSRIKRHYTLNIDGLAEVVGMDTWHHERNPNGCTVEMHGNIRQLVCPSCHFVEPLSRTHINTMKALQPVRCSHCQTDDMRFKIMLYDDDQGGCITPEHVFETLEEDLEAADLVLWVGISFEQSASVEYFRRVRQLLSSAGRLKEVKQAIINPSDDAYFNIISSVCNVEDLELMDVRAIADVALPALAQRMQEHACGMREPSTAAAGAPAAAKAANSGSVSGSSDSSPTAQQPQRRGRGRPRQRRPSANEQQLPQQQAQVPKVACVGPDALQGLLAQQPLQLPIHLGQLQPQQQQQPQCGLTVWQSLVASSIQQQQQKQQQQQQLLQLAGLGAGPCLVLPPGQQHAAAMMLPHAQLLLGQAPTLLTQQQQLLLGQTPLLQLLAQQQQRQQQQQQVVKVEVKPPPHVPAVALPQAAVLAPAAAAAAAGTSALKAVLPHVTALPLFQQTLVAAAAAPVAVKQEEQQQQPPQQPAVHHEPAQQAQHVEHACPHQLEQQQQAAGQQPCARQQQQQPQASYDPGPAHALNLIDQMVARVIAQQQ